MNNSTVFDIFHNVALIILTPHCFDNYFIQQNYFDGPCFKSTLSKCLGVGIILGSLLVKVPQILKIMKNKSGEGINMFSVTLDLTAISIYMSYSFVKGFPFSAWGDTAFLAVQTLLVGVLVLWYSGAVLQSQIYLGMYLVACFILMGGITPIEILWILTTVNILIVVVGKSLQAWTNYKNGHTGQLSAVTLFMLLGGSSARIFTSIQETGDPIVILTYIASTSVNAVLVYQLLYYWNVEAKRKTD